MSTLKVAVLISGQGSNMLAIARACAAQAIDAAIATVISDRPAAGIAAAAALGIHAQVLPAAEFSDRAAFEATLAAAIEASGARLVALAGFMRVLSADFVRRYAGRLLNVHPSLLPHYKGLHTHRRVLQAREAVHGTSVHFVTAELDGGPVICQARLAVHADDDEQTLRARVQALEHRIYPRVIGLIAAGRLTLDGSSVRLDGRVLAEPLLQEIVDEQAPDRPRPP